jgi:hypothetical protein
MTRARASALLTRVLLLLLASSLAGIALARDRGRVVPPAGARSAPGPVASAPAEAPRTVPAPAAERDAVAERIAAAIAAHDRAEAPPLVAPLAYLAQVREERGAEAARAAAERMGLPLSGEAVRVVVLLAEAARTTSDVPPAVRGYAAEGVAGSAIPARVPAGELRFVAGAEGVERLTVQPGLRPTVLGEGAGAIDAGAWVEANLPGALPLDRAPRVAIIDFGYENYAALLGSDLPEEVATAVLCDNPDGTIEGCDPTDLERHGTGVAEIVHEVAPHAELFLITFDGTGLRLQEAVELALGWNADVISTSLGTIYADRGGEGGFCPLARQVRDAGTIWVTAAGNEGSPCQHEHYAWDPSGVDAGENYGDYQSFPAKQSDILDEFILPAGAFHRVELTWNFWNATPSDDFDLFYFCDFGQGYELVEGGTSTSLQCGEPGTLPWEIVEVQNNTGGDLRCAYAVAEWNPEECPHRADAVFDVWSLMLVDGVPVCPDLEFSTERFTINHPGDCRDTFTAGAVCVFGGAVEPFSSRGPTLDDRIKPDICAPDAVSSNAYGPVTTACRSGFLGTSAATPHVAGAIALLYHKVGNAFSLGQITEILRRRAVPVSGVVDPQNSCGSGALCLDSRGCTYPPGPFRYDRLRLAPVERTVPRSPERERMLR